MLLLLLVFKLFYPDSVHINRGWPEDGNANRFFGFFEEVRKKCGGPRIFSLFQNLFACLPVASVVDRSVLVVHGGLSRHTGVLLEHLRGIPMVHELPNNPTTFEVQHLRYALTVLPPPPAPSTHPIPPLPRPKSVSCDRFATLTLLTLTTGEWRGGVPTPHPPAVRAIQYPRVPGDVVAAAAAVVNK